MEHTFDVDVHGFLPLLCSGLHQRRGHRDARVRHHDVQAAEVPDVSRHGRVNARRIGDIYSEVRSNFRAAEASGHRLVRDPLRTAGSATETPRPSAASRSAIALPIPARRQ